MNKKLRRIFMVEHDVMPSRRQKRDVVLRTWPPGMSQTVQNIIAHNRLFTQAQREVWGLPEVFPSHLFPEGRTEVFARYGDTPVLIASHIVDPDEQRISLGREWAMKMGLDFAMLPVGESWHDENVEQGATVAVFLFKRPSA